MGKCVWFFEPFKLWALFCLLFWFSLGPLLGGGCIVAMTFFRRHEQDDRRRRSCFVFVMVFVLGRLD